MTNTITEKKSEESAEKLLGRIKRMLLFLTVFVMVAPVLFGYWLSLQYPTVDDISIDNLQAVGETDLCPGETLIVAFDFHTRGSGVLVRDNTARYVEPPKTIIFSNSRRFVLEGPVDEHVVEAWHVPATYVNPETDEITPVPPGDYVRNFSISSPSSSDVIAIASVPFTIRAKCPKGETHVPGDYRDYYHGRVCDRRRLCAVAAI